MTKKILLLPGDGIGPEIVTEAEKVLNALSTRHGLDIELEQGLLGGIAFEQAGDPYPEVTKTQARAADAILMGAVGGPQFDNLPREKRPESGLLRIRADLDLFCNLRPALLYPQLADASSLKTELVAGLDLMIVRELTGGIYFGQPRGIEDRDGVRTGFDTMVYSEPEVERIGRVAFEIAMQRNKRLCSVDKANVLSNSQLWREVIDRLATEYPEVEVEHLYVDNAAMQLVRAPKQFDVMVTTNMFGDILSDCAAMLTGSIGMLPSASMNASKQGLYEPVHGSAPDIAGQNVANPLATILSAAMLLRYSFDETEQAERIEAAVSKVLDDGLRTADIGGQATCSEMGDAVVAAL